MASLTNFALPNRIVIVGLAPGPGYYSSFSLRGVLLGAAHHRNKAKSATWAGKKSKVPVPILHVGSVFLGAFPEGVHVLKDPRYQSRRILPSGSSPGRSCKAKIRFIPKDTVNGAKSRRGDNRFKPKLDSLDNISGVSRSKVGSPVE